ncbi:MAG: hypothetical protein Hens3KO_25900 [Henriciella sp.]
MLQFYDRMKSTSLLALAAAGGCLLAPTALAATGCNTTDGYDADLSAYVTEATTCIRETDRLRTDVSDDVIALLNADRVAGGLEPLGQRESLDQAAAAHALDMSSRRYAAHSDKEGRDHIYRVRAFDRSLLLGATGANVIVTKPGASAAEIYQTLKEDELNAKNLVRDGFSDIGMAVAEYGGQYYIVQIFASVEGELKQDLPLKVSQNTPIRATLSDGTREVIGWGLTDHETGEVLARGKSSRMRSAFLKGSDAATLDFVVTDQQSTYILKGPMITAQ